ncbi:MAG: allantoicase [Pseudomonadota bacterium]
MNSIDQHPLTRFVNLAQPRLGSEVVYATDDFFADRTRLILPEEPVYIPGKYDTHGKWMDGWESRRRRTEGHDYCIVRLGVPGRIHGFDIDTRHFTGNFPPAASIDACYSDEVIPGDDADWEEIVRSTELNGNLQHFISVDDEREFTHVRLHIYPDGGIARLRIYGTITPNWAQIDDNTTLDLLALTSGGRAIACNDEHFGSMRNLNAPGRGINMGDGWETARRRIPGNDWVVMALGHTGIIDAIEVDTAHFKGNYPDRVMIQGAHFISGTDEAITLSSEQWEVLLPETHLSADQVHRFVVPEGAPPVSHIRMNIFPDGGVSRLRVFGRLYRDERD